jgi:clan AA aspartic protease
MGMVHANIELINTYDFDLFRRGIIKKEEIKSEKVRALVDSGSYMLSINEHIKSQLDIKLYETREAVLADGTIKVFEIVGTIDIKFENRSTTCRAIVLPGKSEVLLGSIPLGDMDCVIDSKSQTLKVNPESPYMATTYLK